MQRFNASFSNFLVCYPIFIALVLIISLTDSGQTALSASIWFWARIAYIPAHISGLPVIRTLLWLTSIAGLIMMLTRLL